MVSKKALKKRKSLAKKTNYFFIVLYILAVVILFLMFRPFLTYMLLGAVLVIIAFPLNLLIRKLVKHKAWAAGIMTLLIILLILVPFIFFSTSLFTQSKVLVSAAAKINLDSLSTDLSQLINYDVDLRTVVFPLLSKLFDFTTGSIPSLIGSVTELFINLFIMFFLMYYLFKEGDVMLKHLLDALPVAKKYKTELANETRKVLKGVLYGQLLVAVIQGILGGIGFWIFGVPNPVLWGFVMMIMAFIPFLGTPLVWGPAVILEFAAGNVGTAIGLLLYSGILVTNIDNFLKPKIIGKETGIHPVLVLLGIFGGIALFGIIGMIIGPVIVALCILIIKYFNRDVVFT